MPDWRPSATVHTLRERARILREIRAFFFARQVLEVETPALASSGNTDPNIHSYEVHDAVLDERQGWLHTSPEFFMKRLLAAGVGDCFQLARVFRGGETGRLHNPEFTMLEWYRLGFSADDLMDEVDALVRAVLPRLDSAQRLDYAEVFHAHVGLDPHAVGRDAMEDWLINQGKLPRGMEGANLADLLSVAFAERVEPALPAYCFVTAFPACQASLARLIPGEPPRADRFELYLNGVELANGFRELTDADEQARRFQAERSRREQHGAPDIRPDMQMIAALEHGLPDCAGVALGLDRLLMLALEKTSVAEVMAFDAERA
ncbi:MAG: EF-P lysine aminoacylase EpmA [Gammaproteobacteria bacterium]